MVNIQLRFHKHKNGYKKLRPPVFDVFLIIDTSTSMMIIYKTKASAIIKLLFMIALLFATTIALMEKNIALLSVTLLIATVIIYIFYTTFYSIYKHTLTIKSGFLFNEEIDINTIKKISRKRKNLLSGPGFSVDRLLIEYNEHDCVIISPNQQQEFLDHIKRINPNIELYNTNT